MLATQSPFPQYFDRDGSPLDDGQLYFGQVNQNPETAPITVYWDAAGTQPAAQPIRTLNGYTYRNGSPAQVYAAADYSITVRDRRGRLVFYSANSAEYSLSSAISGISADLSNTASATNGAGMVGNNPLLTYQANTVGDELKRIYWLKSLGCKGDDSTDDTLKFQAACDLLPNGGILLGERGKTYKLTTAAVFKAGTIFDGQGCTIKLYLNGGSLTGLRGIGKYAIQNCTVQVVSTGSPGSQGGIHACITVGPLVGDSPSVGSVSVYEGANCTLRNLRLSGNRAGRPVVQVTGGCSGVMEDIEVLDGVHSGLHWDWGTVGNIDASDIPGSRTRFNGGTAYTTHPNNWAVYKVKIGTLTDANSHGLRLSGVHDIGISDVVVAGSTFAGFYHTAGDCGYEFAPAAVKPLRHKGISVTDVIIQDAKTGYGFFSDCEADNVAAAVGGGYVPLLPPIQYLPITFTGCSTSSTSASAIAGFRIQKQIGGRLLNCGASGHEYGALIEIGGDSVHIDGGEWTANRKSGIYIGNGTDMPEDVTITNVRSHSNGTDAAYTNSAGIEVANCSRPRLLSNRLGITGEATQDNGIRLDTATVIDATALNNYVFGIQSGFAYAMGSSTTYTTLFVFDGNDCASSIANKYAGPNIMPVQRHLCADGVTRGRFKAARAALTGDTTPTAGTWKLGDIIEHTDPTGANTGTRCTTAGTPGTWGLF